MANLPTRSIAHKINNSLIHKITVNDTVNRSLPHTEIKNTLIEYNEIHNWPSADYEILAYDDKKIINCKIIYQRRKWNCIQIMTYDDTTLIMMN